MFASFTVNGMGLVSLRQLLLEAPKWLAMSASILILFNFGFFILGLWSIRKKIRKNTNLLIFFFAPVLVASLIGFFAPVFSPRALIIVAPFYYLLMAMGIFSLKKRWLVGGLLGFWTIYSGLTLFHPFLKGPPLKKAATFIESQHQNKEIILHSSPMTFYSFHYYHRGSLPEFLMIDPAFSQPIFEIGGYQKSLNQVSQELQNVWLVNDTRWTNPDRLKEARASLEVNHIFAQEIIYDNIQLSHYLKKP
jgi:hypothetical protein